jgi:type VII secretion integral membrane protein EccD
MTTRTAPARLAAVTGAEMCRLTVRTTDRRCDLALPATAPIGELLPLVIGEQPGQPDPSAWVLQRLGGPPLDPGATPESLGLYDGDVLYVSPAAVPLPEAEFDDVSVGVAQIVGARSDQWRPELTRLLLLAAAIAVAVAFGIVAAQSRSHALTAVWCGSAAVGLTAWSSVINRVLADRVSAVTCGLGACLLGALAGLGAVRAPAGLFTVDHTALALVGVCTAVPAAVLSAVGRLPITLFGTVAGWGTALCVGAVLASAFHWDAAQSAAVLAVVVFATAARGVRIVLRLARLRAPLLPRTAQELQQDVDPEPKAVVGARGARAVACLNALFLTAAALSAAASVTLARRPGWIGWTLAVVLSISVLLRSGAVTSAWQRAPLALAGLVGLVAVAAARAGHTSPAVRTMVLLGLLLGAAGLLAASRLMPGRRLLPVWGQTADVLEMWTAVGLVPLLLELFHVFSHIRSLIH